jgi:hypothetical protein
MPLALIYIFVTAKPISIRRLSALFVSALTLSTLALRALQIKDSNKDAFLIAALLTLLVWITPLLCVLRDTIRYRGLSLDALRPVSVCVRATYGCAFAVPIVALVVTADGALALHPVIVLQLIATAGLYALFAHTGFKGSRRAGQTVGHQCTGSRARSTIARFEHMFAHNIWTQ